MTNLNVKRDTRVLMIFEHRVGSTLPRRGGWRAWGAVRADFERALAGAADPAIAATEVASELRRGAVTSG
jgi:hypothetical protein